VPYVVGLYRRRFRRWQRQLRDTPAGELAYAIGLFVLIYCSIGGLWLFVMLSAGVNPTLVLSPLSAPVWILIVLSAYRLQKFIRGA